MCQDAVRALEAAAAGAQASKERGQGKKNERVGKETLYE
jgi:hypothetical protein